MADKKLKFLDRLDAEQTEYAEIIGTRAKALGIPPALAISIAYQESGLRPNVARGKDGEFGIMQVMPSTGKMFGFNNKELADPEKNIEAGLMVLQKALIDMGGDTRMAVVAYNKGADHPFFSGGPLPKVTETYLQNLNGFGTFDLTGKTVDVDANMQAYLKEQGGEDETGGELVRKPPLQEQTNASQPEIDRQKLIAQGAGAGLGVAIAGKDFVAQKAGDAAEMLGRRNEQGRQGVRVNAGIQPPPMAAAGAPGAAGAPFRASPGATPPAAPPGAPGASGPRQPPQIPGLTLTGNYEKPYAGHGSANANYLWKFGGTDTDLLKVASMADQEGGGARFVKERAAGLARAREGTPGYSLSERPSGVLTLENYRSPREAFVQQGATSPAAANMMPPGSALQPPQKQGALVPRNTPSVTPPKVSGLDQAKNLFMELGGFTREVFSPFGRAAAAVAAPVLKYGLPPVALAQAAGEGVEAFHQGQGPNADYIKAGLTGLAALGTGMSAFPGTMAAGIPLAIGATGINAIRDRYQKIKENPEAYRSQVNEMLTNVDPMGNPY